MERLYKPGKADMFCHEFTEMSFSPPLDTEVQRRAVYTVILALDEREHSNLR